jgi:tetratricopeptide (TPR) repeat protein
MEKNRLFYCLNIGLLLSVACTLSCMTSCTTTPANSSLVTTSKDFMIEADEYFKRGQYKTALVKYSSYVYSPFSDKKNIDYARYRLGLCHYLLGQYGESKETLRSLLEESANFSMADEARELVKKSEIQIQTAQDDLDQSRRAIELKIAQLEQKVQSQPNSGQTHYQLADLYWDAGLFTQSIQEYKKAVESDPALLKGDTLRNRVRITRDGEYKLRDPMLDLTQTGDVIVEDARIDRVTRSNWLGESETLRVTGYVVNNGVRDVGNVQIEVTIKDIWDAIQGTRVLHIGELHAGSKKPFMIRMDEFTGASQDIKNIHTVVYYDK